jgi:predicted rRNA methylase YqxC with S4 and FtsJ domains
VSIILFARIIPVKPPKLNAKRNPIINNKGVIKKKQLDQRVANQFKIFIPVGIAIMEVALV